MIAAGLGGWFFGGLLGTQPERVGGSVAGALALGKVVVLAGTMLIFLGFLRSDPEIWPDWSVYLGKISYGLYMYHMPVVYATAFLFQRMSWTDATGWYFFPLYFTLVFALTWALASGSYYVLEKPLLRYSKRFQ